MGKKKALAWLLSLCLLAGNVVITDFSSLAAEIQGDRIQKMIEGNGEVATDSDCCQEEVEEQKRMQEQLEEGDPKGIGISSPANAAFRSGEKIYYLNWEGESPEKDYHYQVLDSWGNPVDQTWWNYEWNDDLDGWHVWARKVQYSYDQINYQYFLFDGGELLGEVPAMIDDRPVVDLGGCFSGSPLETVPDIPKTVVSLSHAFSHTAISSMPDLPAMTINLDHAFENCKELKNLSVIPPLVETMEAAFYGSGIEETPIFSEEMGKLKSLKQTFAQCKKLQRVNPLPEVSGMEGTFSGSFVPGFDGRQVSLPDSVEYLDSTFAGSRISHAPSLPPRVKSIDQMFYGCGELVDIPLFPETLESAAYAFFDCSSLAVTDGSTYVVLPRSLTGVRGMFAGSFGSGSRPVDSEGRNSQLIFFQDEAHYKECCLKSGNDLGDMRDQYGDLLMTEGDPAGGMKEILTVAPRIHSELVVHEGKRALEVVFGDYYEKGKSLLGYSDFFRYEMDVTEYRVNHQGEYQPWDGEPLYFDEDTLLEVRKRRTISGYDGEREIITEVREKYLGVEQPDTPDLFPTYLGGGCYEVEIVAWSRLRSLGQFELFYRINDGEICPAKNREKVTLHCGDRLTAWADWGALSETAVYTAPEYVKWMTIEGLEEQYYGRQSLPVTVRVGDADAGDKTYKLSLVSGNEIARLEEGCLKNEGEGTVVIRAEALDGSGVWTERQVVFCGEYIPVTSLNLEFEEERDPQIGLAERPKLHVKIGPEDASDKEYSYIVSDSKVLEIEGDVIRPKRAGRVSITAYSKADPSVSDRLDVEVLENLSYLQLQGLEEKVMSGDPMVIILSYGPSEYGKDIQVKVNCDEAKIVRKTLSQGVEQIEVTIRTLGKYQVTAIYEGIGGHREDRCEFEVLPRPVESVKILADFSYLFPGDQRSLSLETIPDKAFADWIWTSSASDIIDVDTDGNVRAIQLGEAAITVRDRERPQVSDSIILQVKTLYLSDIKVKGRQQMTVGEEQKLETEVTPSNSGALLLWESDYSDIVEVSQDGTVQARQPGIAVITVSNEEKTISAKFSVTVAERAQTVVRVAPLSGVIEAEDGNLTFKNTILGTQICFQAQVETAAEDTSVTWQVLQPDLADIDSEGRLKPNKNGTVTVRALANDGSGCYADYSLEIKTVVEWIDVNVRGNCEFEEADRRKIRAGTTLTVKAVYPEDADWKHLYFSPRPAAQTIYGPTAFEETFEFIDGVLQFQEDTIVEVLHAYQQGVNRLDGYITTSMDLTVPGAYYQKCSIGADARYQILDPRQKYVVTEQQLSEGYEVQLYDRIEEKLLSSEEIRKLQSNFCEAYIRSAEGNGLVVDKGTGDYIKLALTMSGEKLYLKNISGKIAVEAFFKSEDFGNSAMFQNGIWMIRQEPAGNFEIQTYDCEGTISNRIIYDEKRDRPWVREDGQIGGDNYLELRLYEGEEEILNPIFYETNRGGSNSTGGYAITVRDQTGRLVNSVFDFYRLSSGRIGMYGMANGWYRLEVQGLAGEIRQQDILVSGVEEITRMECGCNDIDSYKGMAGFTVILTNVAGERMMFRGTQINYEFAHPEGYEMTYQLMDEENHPYLHLENGFLSCDGMCPDQSVKVLAKLSKDGDIIAQASTECRITNQVPAIVWESESSKTDIHYGECLPIKYYGRTSYANLQLDNVQLEYSTEEYSDINRNISPENDGQFRFVRTQRELTGPTEVLVAAKYTKEALKYFSEEELASGRYPVAIYKKITLVPDYTCSILAESLLVCLGDVLELGVELKCGEKEMEYSTTREGSKSYLSATIEQIEGEARLEILRKDSSKGEPIYRIIPKKTGNIRLKVQCFESDQYNKWLRAESSVTIAIQERVSEVTLCERNNKVMIYEGEGANFYLKYKEEKADDRQQFFELIEDTTDSFVDADSGEFRAGKEGTVVICGKNGPDSSVSDTYTLQIIKKPTAPEGLKVSPEAVTAEKGEIIKYAAEIWPKEAVDQEVVWEVSGANGRIQPTDAFITQNGEFVGNKTGSYRIRAWIKEYPELTAEASVRVETSPQKLRISGKQNISPGETIQLSAEILPEDCGSQEIQWSVVENPQLAEIDESGCLRAFQTVGSIKVQAIIAGTKIQDTMDIFIGLELPPFEVEVRDIDDRVHDRLAVGEVYYLYVDGELCSKKYCQENQCQITISGTDKEGSKGLYLDEYGRLYGTERGTYEITADSLLHGLEVKGRREVSVYQDGGYEVLSIYPEDGDYTAAMKGTKQMGVLVQPSLGTGDYLLWSVLEGEAFVDETGKILVGEEGESLLIGCALMSAEGEKLLDQSCRLKIVEDIPYMGEGETMGEGEKTDTPSAPSVDSSDESTSDNTTDSTEDKSTDNTTDNTTDKTTDKTTDNTTDKTIDSVSDELERTSWDTSYDQSSKKEPKWSLIQKMELETENPDVKNREMVAEPGNQGGISLPDTGDSSDRCKVAVLWGMILFGLFGLSILYSPYLCDRKAKKCYCSDGGCER